MKEPSVSFVEWNAFMTCGVAGAIIVDARGLLLVSRARLTGVLGTHDNMVMRETMPIAPIFFAELQFIGLAGSSGLSQSTMFGFFGAFSWAVLSEPLFSWPGWLSTSCFGVASSGWLVVLELTEVIPPRSYLQGLANLPYPWVSIDKCP